MQTEVKLFVGLKEFHNHPEDCFIFMPSLNASWLLSSSKSFLVLLKAEVPKYFNEVSSYGIKMPGVNSQQHDRKRMQTFLRLELSLE